MIIAIVSEWIDWTTYLRTNAPESNDDVEMQPLSLSQAIDQRMSCDLWCDVQKVAFISHFRILSDKSEYRVQDQISQKWHQAKMNGH